MHRIYERALAAYELGQYEACCQCAIDGLREAPQDIDLLVLLGHANLSLSEFAAARTWGQHAIEVDPEDARGFAVLAWATILDVQYDPSARSLLGAPSSDGQVLEEFIGFDPKLADQARIKHGRGLAARCLELNPQQASYFSLLAEIEFLSDDVAAALEAANLGLAVDPSHPSSAQARTRALGELRRFDEAIATARNQLSFDPEDATCHHQLGKLYLEKRNLDLATRHARNAVRLQPNMDQYRQTYWDTVKARNPLLRPFVQWQFVALRLSKVFRQRMIAMGTGIALCCGALAALTSTAFEFEGAPLLALTAMIVGIFLVSSERPCMLLVDLMMCATDREYRFTVEPVKIWIDAATTLLAFALIASFVSAAFGIYLPMCLLVIGLFLAAPSYFLWKAQSKWIKVSFALSILAMLALASISIDLFYDAPSGTRDRLVAIYYFIGFLAIGITGPILYSHFTRKESYLKS